VWLVVAEVQLEESRGLVSEGRGLVRRGRCIAYDIFGALGVLGDFGDGERRCVGRYNARLLAHLHTHTHTHTHMSAGMCVCVFVCVCVYIRVSWLCKTLLHTPPPFVRQSYA
jgi:hypothetical protein